MINFHILTYIIALLHYTGKASASQLSRTLLKYSHDFFTDILVRDFQGETLLAYCIQRIHPLTRGYLIIDDTWTPKCFSWFLEAVTKSYSGKYKRPMWGISIVMLLWTDGKWRIPLSIRIWHRGGPSKPDLAFEMLSRIRNKLHWKPDWVVFDSGYATKKILRLLQGYGWSFVCQCPKSRRLDGVKLWQYKRQGFWTEVGEAWYGQKVKAIRVKDRFYLCNRLLWERKRILEVYSSRVVIEEVFRILKQTGGWIGCQSRDIAAYERHLYLCLISFLVLEATRIQEFGGITIYRLRENLISRKTPYSPPILKRISAAA
jgi:hypothetical protein